jgi:hypothetical protein
MSLQHDGCGVRDAESTCCRELLQKPDADSLTMSLYAAKVETGEIP